MLANVLALLSKAQKKPQPAQRKWKIFDLCSNKKIGEHHEGARRPHVPHGSRIACGDDFTAGKALRLGGSRDRRLVQLVALAHTSPSAHDIPHRIATAHHLEEAGGRFADSRS